MRGLLWAQTHGTVVIGTGLAADRAGLAARARDPSCCSQPWLLLALAIYVVNLGIAFFVQRPNLRSP